MTDNISHPITVLSAIEKPISIKQICQVTIDVQQGDRKTEAVGIQLGMARSDI